MFPAAPKRAVTVVCVFAPIMDPVLLLYFVSSQDMPANGRESFASPPFRKVRRIFPLASEIERISPVIVYLAAACRFIR